MQPSQMDWDYGPLGTSTTGTAGKRTVYPDEWKRLHEFADHNNLPKRGDDRPRHTSIDVAPAHEDHGDRPPNLLELYEQLLAGPPGDDGCTTESPPAGCAAGCAWLRYDALGAAIAAVPVDVCSWKGRHGGDRGPLPLVENRSTKNPEWYQLHPLAAARVGVHLYRQQHRPPDIRALVSSQVSVSFVSGHMLCPDTSKNFFDECSVPPSSRRRLWQMILEHDANITT